METSVDPQGTAESLLETGTSRLKTCCKMPNYKLYYFNARGRAEAIRLCFAAAGVEYEDVRFSKEEWQKKKAEGFSPLGYLPMLEVDGKKLCESNAILEFVGRETGICPCDIFKVFLCDEIVEACGDCLRKMVKVYFQKDPEIKKALKEVFDNTQLPIFLTNMTHLLKRNNDGKGFFVGDKLSYADVAFFDLCEKLEPSATEKFPEIKALLQCLNDIKGIKEWLQKRPETPF